MDILKTIILMLIIPTVCFFIKHVSKNYFNEKAKNLATKEDIKDITIKVEKVKTDYMNQSYAWRKFFDFELDSIKNLWSACWELQSSARALRPIIDSLPLEKEKREVILCERYNNYCKKMNLFVDLIIKNQPFIPPEIYTSSLELRELAIPLEVDLEMCLSLDSKPEWKTIIQKNKELDLKIDELNAQIRDYIYVKLEPKNRH